MEVKTIDLPHPESHELYLSAGDRFNSCSLLKQRIHSEHFTVWIVKSDKRRSIILSSLRKESRLR
jgi:hypothetical protein